MMVNRTLSFRRLRAKEFDRGRRAAAAPARTTGSILR
jgi:hypothetical protein